MIIFIFKCAVLVSVIKITSSNEVGCPLFQFSRNGSLSARIVVPTPYNHNNVVTLHVQLSIGTLASYEDIKKGITFLGNETHILYNRPLIYQLELPSFLNNFINKITKIWVNDEYICSSAPLDVRDFNRDESISTIDLQYTFTISTNSYSKNTKNNYYRTQSPSPSPKIVNTPPNSYSTNTPNIYYMTQSPPPWPKIINTPKPIVSQPFNQNFPKIDCYKSSQSITLIYNGEDALNEEYPWVGALVKRIKKSKIEFQCGATLITKKLALTAAHCVVPNERNELHLIFGTSDIDDIGFNKVVQTREVTRRIVHPQYNKDTSDADVAMLIFSEELRLTSTVQPICLPNFEDTFENIENKTGVVAGWGKDEHNVMSPNLKKSYAGIVNEDSCLWTDDAFAPIISNRTFCAGDRNGSGPCRGDSGSGFYMVVKERWIIKGIVSRAKTSSDGGCDLFHYVVYVDVAKHLDWINHWIYQYL